MAQPGGSAHQLLNPRLPVQDRFYFTSEQLQNTPSRKLGMDADQELTYRQRAANLIQDMGQRLHVSQLCINTAIVYMHRFYACHSFTHFHRNAGAQVALFLAAKVEEQPRKIEHVIKVAHLCSNTEAPEPGTAAFNDQANDIVANESLLLQSLGFDLAVDHPHTHVVRTCTLVKATKELAQTSYFMASNSLHLTTMCLQYRPTVIACFCIHIACKWSRWEIPQSTEGKHWFEYVDKSVTPELLAKLTEEFLHIFDRCPTRLRRLKNMNIAEKGGAAAGAASNDDGASTSSASAGPSSSSSSTHRDSSHRSSGDGAHHKSQQNPHARASSDHSKSSRPSSSHMPRPQKSDRPANASSSSSHAAFMQPPTSNADPATARLGSSGSSSSSSGSGGGGGSGSRGGQQSQQSQNSMYALPKFPSSSTGLYPQRPPSSSSSGLAPNMQPPSKQQQQQHNGSGGVQQQPKQERRMHPATIGVGPGGGQQPPDMRKSHKQQPPQQQQQQAGGYNMPQQKHPRMPPQQQHSKPPTHSAALVQHNRKHPSSSTQSFTLLDESINPSETLRASPTDMKPKLASIFSPEYKDADAPLTVYPQPPTTANPVRGGGSGSSGGNGNLNHNNNNNGANPYSKPKHASNSLPNSLMMDNPLDFLKQDNELPQQLFATTPIKSEKRRLSPEDADPREKGADSKMIKLETRMEGKRPTTQPPNLVSQMTADAASSGLMKSHAPIPKMSLPREDVKSSLPPPSLQHLPHAQHLPLSHHQSTHQLPPPSSSSSSSLSHHQLPQHQQQPSKHVLQNGGVGMDADHISSLLKEINNKPVLPVLEATTQQQLHQSVMDSDVMMPSTSHNVHENDGGDDATESHHHHHRSKSEKKKKKDKHKHKDRTKDREEKKEKKHKKDKHRDRSRERHAIDTSSATQYQHHHHSNSTNNSSGAAAAYNHHPAQDSAVPTGSLKIKIPKDKIRDPVPPPQQPPLKLKISKNIL